MFLVNLGLIWLSKAHVAVPVSDSMIMAGVVFETGGYGLVRLLKILSLFFKIGFSRWIFVSLICLCQFDIKSLLAYSFVAHI